MTRFLLDTHAALFWWQESAELSPAAEAAISHADNAIYVSAASGWEIATKFRLGKLAFHGNPMTDMPRLMVMHDFNSLDVTMAHTLRAGMLPGEHRDPFDRLIAAQALIEGMTVITRDAKIADFGCKVLW
ncbi:MULTISPECIES: type II toxin-antitoxin system VapC family toxin [unclassified Sphingomonas]|uniref:type II toxin-antitoxin system VapC family toxin n=1 Tax=unclassified Sphingomonas TaxID=196159 RepID=UPI000E100396|nr:MULTISPECIES: type II toxin-antitoxin system VapC family toxin [unclassified Sphingomonas]AXJ95069.1 PIN domain nuclease [Sphingomonas sp. FARSPH]